MCNMCYTWWNITRKLCVTDMWWTIFQQNPPVLVILPAKAGSHTCQWTRPHLRKSSQKCCWLYKMSWDRWVCECGTYSSSNYECRCFIFFPCCLECGRLCLRRFLVRKSLECNLAGCKGHQCSLQLEALLNRLSTRPVLMCSSINLKRGKGEVWSQPQMQWAVVVWT